jgi:hypothetical protein
MHAASAVGGWECAIHEANSLVLTWPVCFTNYGLVSSLFCSAFLNYSLPSLPTLYTHPSLLLVGGSKHRRWWFKPTLSSGAKPMLPPLLLRPLGPWASHSAPIWNTFLICRFVLQALPWSQFAEFSHPYSKHESFCSILSHGSTPTLFLPSFLHTTPLNSSSLHCLRRNGLCIIKWAAACITSDMIRGSTPACTTLHKQVERTP